MAHFYGRVAGARNPVTRLGTPNSGLTTTAASWQGSVEVILTTRDGIDYAEVWLLPWQGRGVRRRLFHGPVSGAGPDCGTDLAPTGPTPAQLAQRAPTLFAPPRGSHK